MGKKKVYCIYESYQILKVCGSDILKHTLLKYWNLYYSLSKVLFFLKGQLNISIQVDLKTFLLSQTPLLKMLLINQPSNKL